MDIAIAGAGIAGLSAAAFLRRLGHRVVIYDQFYKPEPVGSGLIIQPTGQAILRSLGLLDSVVSSGSRIDRLYGEVTSSKRVALDVRYSALGDSSFGIGIHRAALFKVLYEKAIASGAEISTRSKVVSVESDPNGANLVFESRGASPKFDLVVDALGLHSPLTPGSPSYLEYGALWTNIPTVDQANVSPVLEQRYFRASKTAGVMPISANKNAFFWSLRQDRYAVWKKEGLNCWKDEVLSLWPTLAPMLDHINTPEQLVFARYAHQTTPNPIEGRVVHIGDAWHAASPQLGQGANMALLDAYALALALQSNTGVEDALLSLEKMRRWHIQLYQSVSAMFTPFYQSSGKVLPWVRDNIATPLSGLPVAQKVLAAMVSGNLGNPLKRLGLSD